VPVIPCLLVLLACRPDPPSPTPPADTGAPPTWIDTGDTDTTRWDTWGPGDSDTEPVPCDFTPEPGRGVEYLDVLARLEAQRCLDDEDQETLHGHLVDGMVGGQLHCDTVFRASSADGLSFDGDAERVLTHASVPDVAIDSRGHHILVYNDLTPYKLHDVIRTDPERIWRQGLLGKGGVGMSLDALDGHGFRELRTLDLALDRVTLAVDPDLGRRADGTWRMLWFGVNLDQYSNGWTSPLHSDKPHNLFRTTSTDYRDYPTASVAVASEDGPFGGVDPTILDLDDGGEILMMGPMPETVLAWQSPDGDDWGDDTALSDFDTEVPGVTPDAMPDPAGGYRLHYMVNGEQGNFQLATSADGRTWDAPGHVMRQADGGKNLSLAIDPDGVWWLYWNETDWDCVAAWEDGPPE